MKLAIFCNNSRGLELIKYLEKKYRIELVIIAKKNLEKSILKYIKDKFFFKIIRDVNRSNIFNLIKKKNIDINIIAGFPYILKKKIIDSSRFGTINLHGGKLPDYRGGSPLNWQIIKNEKKIGLSIIKISEQIDKGPLVAKTSFILKKTDSINDVKLKSFKFFKKIIIKSINKFIKKKFLKIDYKKGCYYKQRNKNDSRIYFNKMTNLQVYNMVRASNHPYDAFYLINNKKVLLKKVIISKIKLTGESGSISKINNFIFIKCKRGAIKVLK